MTDSFWEIIGQVDYRSLLRSWIVEPFESTLQLLRADQDVSSTDTEAQDGLIRILSQNQYGASSQNCEDDFRPNGPRSMASWTPLDQPPSPTPAGSSNNIKNGLGLDKNPIQNNADNLESRCNGDIITRSPKPLEIVQVLTKPQEDQLRPYGAYISLGSSREASTHSKVDEERTNKLRAAIQRRRSYIQRHGKIRPVSESNINRQQTSGGYAGYALKPEVARSNSKITKYSSPFKSSNRAERIVRVAQHASLSDRALNSDRSFISTVRHRLAPNLDNIISSPLAEYMSPVRQTPRRSTPTITRRKLFSSDLSESQSLNELLRLLVSEGQATDFPSFRELQERRKERLKYIEDLRRPKIEKIQPVSRDQLRIVNETLQNGNSGKTLISAFRIDISVRDIRTLGVQQWLNDNVIDFYLEMINQRSKEHITQGTNFPRSFTYTTHFYTTLCSKGYQGVARWGKRKQLNLAMTDYIFVPINVHNTHWCLSMINLKKKRFEFYDSLAGRPGAAFKFLREYIINESQTQNVPLKDMDDWTDYIPQDSPVQKNGYDCGVFTCKTVEVLSRDGILSFGQRDMPTLRNRMIYEILQGKLLD
ncbi:uncharacterized protein V1516DRAFT_672057 [Lipomyces oligophaga]|uniref:uncharacterized protein n=1 Tax=Lipomyces oligophaga TaxID=45792 RepID=UPI0034CDB51E